MSDGLFEAWFDLALPPIELEAGARVAPHLARGWALSSSDDRAWLASRGRLLPPVDRELVVRRDAREVERTYHDAHGARTDGARTDGARIRAASAPMRPTILVVPPLTSAPNAGGPIVGEANRPRRGFWAPLVGPGKALDPRTHRILAFNVLGSCYGSSGPCDATFPRREDDHLHPPLRAPGPLTREHAELPCTVTTWDQARAILAALDALGLETIDMVVGGSIGGLIALCLAVLAPTRFATIVPIAAAARASAWVIGWNHVARQIILADPTFPHGHGRGLEIARTLAMMTYRSERGLEERHGRAVATLDGKDDVLFAPDRPYRVQTYLERRGKELAARFDARAYLTLLGAMDHHDVERRPPAIASDAIWGLRRVTSRVLAIGIASDRLFPADETLALVETLRRSGKDAHASIVESPHGHDAYLVEWETLGRLLSSAVQATRSPAGAQAV